MGNLTNTQRIRPIAALVVAVVFWASAFIAIRAVVASRAYTPGQLSAGRLLVASALLSVVALARGGIRLPRGRDWITFVVLGATGMMLYQLLLNTGERTVDGGTAALLVATSPILASLMAVAFLGERMSRLGWVGTTVAFAGAATVAISSGASLAGGLGSGVLLVVAATCVWAIFLVTQKTLAARYDSLELTAWPMWIGAALLLPFAGGLPHAVAVAPLSATAAVLFLGVCSSVLGFLAWAYAIQRLEVVVATTALYTVPVAAFVVGLVFLGEVPQTSALLGGAIAIAGVALVQAKGRPSLAPRSLELDAASAIEAEA